MYKLVLLRHGQSIWNKKNLFTGWHDSGLSVKGKKEARRAGRLLKAEGFVFDIAFCSVLKRAVQTLKIVLKEMGLEYIPVEKSWRLNERHYGALQGLEKKAVSRKYGPDQVFIWRRSFQTRPPALSKKSELWPGNDPLYKNVKKEFLPFTESLKDTLERILPFWKQEIAPAVKAGKKVLISAHGSTSRAFIKYFDGLSDKEIARINVPCGTPLVYELGDNLQARHHYYLGDKEQVERAIKEVAGQARP